MKSLAKQETQPKPRLIVRLGVFLASHHILFRFTILSPCCSLNPYFHPFNSLFTISGQCYMLLCRHYRNTAPSFTCKKHIPLGECSYTWYFTLFSIFVYCYSIDAFMLFLKGVPVWWPYTQIFRLHTVDIYNKVLCSVLSMLC